ncbi:MULTISPECIES: hypothetical protein [Caballeronia]|uniref:hypothetical protein n=1 Tax=Caballeronia TaxID=1827195 RepID=UPI00031F576C|nr:MULTISPECIES: hypothetical protein [Caballeronia]
MNGYDPVSGKKRTVEAAGTSMAFKLRTDHAAQFGPTNVERLDDCFIVTVD